MVIWRIVMYEGVWDLFNDDLNLNWVFLRVFCDVFFKVFLFKFVCFLLVLYYFFFRGLEMVVSFCFRFLSFCFCFVGVFFV